MKQFLDIFDDSIVNTLSNFLCLQTFTFLPGAGIVPFDSRIIRSVFVLFVCFINIIYTGIWLQLVDSFPRTSFQVLNVMHYLIEAAISIIYVTVGLVRTRNVIEHVNLFFKADKIMLSLDIPIPFQQIAREQLKIILITLAVFSLALTIDMIHNITDSKRFFIWVTEKIFLMYNLYSQLFFIVLLRNYVYRFDLIWQEIGDVTKKKSYTNSTDNELTSKIRLLMIQRALSIYVKILVHLNYKDSIQHLLQVISYIMTFTITSFIIYNHCVDVAKHDVDFQWKILSPVIAWTFFKISGLFILTVGTASVVTQVITEFIDCIV